MGANTAHCVVFGVFSRGGRFSVGIVEYNKGHGLTLSGLRGSRWVSYRPPTLSGFLWAFLGALGHGRRSGFGWRNASFRRYGLTLLLDGQKRGFNGR